MASFDILVVDDSYPMARTIAYALRSNGYGCRIATDGFEALQKMKEQRPDVVILDIRMPGMDGIEVCRKMRQNKALKDVYVLMLSGVAQDSDYARAIEAGADECVSKPFDPPKVLERVRAVLSPVEP